MKLLRNKFSNPIWLSIIFLLLISLMLYLMVGSSVLVNDNLSLPSDAELEETFRNHEDDFNQLIEMSQVDSKVIRIASNFTWLDDNLSYPRPESELGFSKERWDEYHQIFVKLGIKGGLIRYPDTGVILFFVSNKGLVTGGLAKGYAYSTKDLTPIYNSLDNFQPSASSSEKPVYKRLNKNWYLFYDFE